MLILWFPIRNHLFPPIQREKTWKVFCRSTQTSLTSGGKRLSKRGGDDFSRKYTSTVLSWSIVEWNVINYSKSQIYDYIAIVFIMSYYIFKIKCHWEMSLILIYQLYSYFRAINLPWIKNKMKVLLNYQKAYYGLCILISGIHCIISKYSKYFCIPFMISEQFLCNILKRQLWELINFVYSSRHWEVVN